MKQIVVVSGKGGSGKTFVSSSFAALAENTVFADCDVDAANLHIMLQPTEGDCESFVSGHAAVVDPARCTSCGACEEACRFGAISLATPLHRATVDPIACEGCGVCALVCQADAISMVAQERGRWCRSRTRFGPLVHAHLEPGEENSGKLVDQVRRAASAVAAETDAELVLIDGPPGTGCAAKSAVTGTDYVLVVAEPTLSGIHDAERVLRLAAHFGIPVGLVVNKADLSPHHTEALRALARDRSLDYLGEIPFSRSVPEALTRLEPYPLREPDRVTEELDRIWTAVRDAAAAATA
ncbi:MAG: ATP-binding protein [Spirochaetota bacterium]